MSVPRSYGSILNHRYQKKKEAPFPYFCYRSFPGLFAASLPSGSCLPFLFKRRFSFSVFWRWCRSSMKSLNSRRGHAIVAVHSRGTGLSPPLFCVTPESQLSQPYSVSAPLHFRQLYIFRESVVCCAIGESREARRRDARTNDCIYHTASATYAQIVVLAGSKASSLHLQSVCDTAALHHIFVILGSAESAVRTDLCQAGEVGETF